MVEYLDSVNCLYLDVNITKQYTTGEEFNVIPSTVKMRKFQYPWYYKMPTGYDGNVLHTKYQKDVVRLRKQPLNQ